MQHPDVADKILKSLLENEGNPPYKILPGIKVEKDVVQSVVIELKSNYKTWFQETDGPSEDPLNFVIKPGYEYIVRAFLQNEGFTGLVKKAREEIKLPEHSELLHQQNVESKDIAPEQSRVNVEEVLRLSRQASEMAERSERVASDAMDIAQHSTQMINRVRTPAIWSAVISAIISSAMTWYLITTFR